MSLTTMYPSLKKVSTCSCVSWPDFSLPLAPAEAGGVVKTEETAEGAMLDRLPE